VGTAIIALCAPGAFAQTTGQTDNGNGSGEVLEEIVITGIRSSLANAAAAKRSSTNFTDSIYAEDIGKFPDLNIAEALNRIPGVQLTREITGEGVQISVRGLGPSFTKVLLNNAQIAVASDGSTDSGNSNREVDLDLFPTELFTKLEVNKTPTAHLLEGGVAGTVNLRNARPFDNPGFNVTYVAQGSYSDSSEEISPRGALIVSKTWGDELGLLLGVAGSSNRFRTDGFESIGWTTPNIAGTETGDTVGGNGFNFATTVPPNAGNGLTPGAPVDPAQTSGLPLDVLSDVLVPRLARPSISTGTRDRLTFLASAEYRPMDTLFFALDAIYAKADRTNDRLDMNWVVRNSNAMIPINLQVDANGVLTRGTFANSQFFLEARPYAEDVEFYSINPSVTYDINDWIRLAGSFNYNRSTFYRSANSYLIQTRLGTGLTVDYDNTGGEDFPTINVNQDLGDPNLVWDWNSVRVQTVERETENLGTRWDLLFGDDDNNIRTGVAYDKVDREITARDNGPAADAFAKAQIPDGTLGAYLKRGPSFLTLSDGDPGYSTFVVPDYGRLDEATNIRFYEETAPFSNSSATNTPSGSITEETKGAYVEANGEGEFLGRTVRFNAGIRGVRTDQTISGPITINGMTSFQTLTQNYTSYLPSFNAVVELYDNLLLRLAGSRSMTRPNPNQMLPGTTFSDPSAQVANQGNPELSPYYSNNVDIGLEYYTGGIGVIAANFFSKSINGFTVNQQVTRPFNTLGIRFEDLTQQQRDALTPRGGVNAPVTVNTQVNVGQTLKLDGVELTYVQPLDFLVEGLGFTGNYTHIEQSASGSAAVATGIGPNNYNVGAYYENYGLSIRLTYVYLDERIVAQAPQNNVSNAELIADASGQIDLSVAYELPWIEDFQVTFNAVNLNNERQRTRFEYDNATYTAYYPGRQYMLGIRGKF